MSGTARRPVPVASRQQPWQGWADPVAPTHRARPAQGRLHGRVAAAVVVALALAGCSSHLSTALHVSPPPSGSPLASPEVLPAASIGGSDTVRGNQPGESLQVQLVSIRDPASSSVVQPDPGNRFVGIQLAVRNVGTSTYHDSPSNGTALFSTDGQRSFADVLDAVQPALGTLTLAPGATASGFITFQVPAGATVARFNLTLDLGFGPQTGTWTLGTA